MFKSDHDEARKKSMSLEIIKNDASTWFELWKNCEHGHLWMPGIHGYIFKPDAGGWHIKDDSGEEVNMYDIEL